MPQTAIITTPAQLAAVLRGRRATSRLTQKQAAAKVGLLPKTISVLESADPGRSSVDSLFKLLSALDVELVVQPRSSASSGQRKAEW
jgi:HTH-type transcriptional regulator/antitoxin HipB